MFAITCTDSRVEHINTHIWLVSRALCYTARAPGNEGNEGEQCGVLLSVLWSLQPMAAVTPGPRLTGHRNKIIIGFCSVCPAGSCNASGQQRSATSTCRGHASVKGLRRRRAGAVVRELVASIRERATEVLRQLAAGRYGANCPVGRQLRRED